MEWLRIIVSGRVQGVGFRYFTQQLATRHQVVGWVQNRPNGEVEALAGVGKSRKQRFLAALEQGPPGSWVEKMSIQAENPPSSPPARGFVIRR